MQSHRKKISESSIQRIICFLFKVIKRKASRKAKPSLKVFSFHELKIKALRYSDANKNIRSNLLDIIPKPNIFASYFKKCTSDSPYRQFDDSDISISDSNCFAFLAKPLLIKSFLIFHLKPFRIQRLRLRESPINDDE